MLKVINFFVDGVFESVTCRNLKFLNLNLTPHCCDKNFGKCFSLVVGVKGRYFIPFSYVISFYLTGSDHPMWLNCNFT